MVALLVIGACDPDIVPLPDDPQPEQPVPTPDPDPEPKPEPEPEPEPNNPLSTLKGDIEVVFSADSSLAYADCFGDYYSTAIYVGLLLYGVYRKGAALYRGDVSIQRVGDTDRCV